MKIRLAQASDEQKIIQLIVGFRKSLCQLRNRVYQEDLTAAREELSEYQNKNFPIYVAEDEINSIIGYLVCRVDGNLVWAESLYVEPKYRQHGIGTSLYVEAERLAHELGNDSLYNWVDPNNASIIGFLQKRGYNILNLIELRRPHPGEEITRKINVGENKFNY